MAIINVNGYDIPAPARGLKEVVTTTVNAGRNANNVVIGEKVGRDQYKLDNLVWNGLSAEQWSFICKLFSNFYVVVKTFDMVNNAPITLKMYPGDRTGQPLKFGQDGLPTQYETCTMNIIDCGVI